mmetsp:Transcript_7525/g.19052  ORF Transcript_7525/g.19052 Transcript_7525/m.19052 type:complete len:103 (+) Transcript_7525:1606-1914(+)
MLQLYPLTSLPAPPLEQPLLVPLGRLLAAAVVQGLGSSDRVRAAPACFLMLLAMMPLHHMRSSMFNEDFGFHLRRCAMLCPRSSKDLPARGWSTAMESRRWN